MAMYWGMWGLMSLPSSSTAAGAVPALRASSNSFALRQSSRDFFLGSSSESVFDFNIWETGVCCVVLAIVNGKSEVRLSKC